MSTRNLKDIPNALLIPPLPFPIHEKVILVYNLDISKQTMSRHLYHQRPSLILYCTDSDFYLLWSSFVFFCIGTRAILFSHLIFIILCLYSKALKAFNYSVYHRFYNGSEYFCNLIFSIFPLSLCPPAILILFVSYRPMLISEKLIYLLLSFYQVSF